MPPESRRHARGRPAPTPVAGPHGDADRPVDRPQTELALAAPGAEA